MLNIESKFRCAEHAQIVARAMEAGASDQGILNQRDVFFEVPVGRLKLRHMDGRAELISYERDDAPVARPSEYDLFSTTMPGQLEAVLARSLPVGRTVEKKRRLFLHGHTRIHLDDVRGLGQFVELETVVGAIDDRDAESEHSELIRLLGLEGFERISVAYVDLLSNG
jgi:adenylate cyclase class IV